MPRLRSIALPLALLATALLFPPGCDDTPAGAGVAALDVGGTDLTANSGGDSLSADAAPADPGAASPDTSTAGDPGAIADASPTDPGPGTDGGVGDAAPGDTTGSDAGAGPWLTIIVEGSLEDRAPDDGLAAQTPKTYRYGLQRLEMLRTADDPSPEVIFDYAPGFVLVDLMTSNTVAHVPIAGLLTDTFSHFRIVLTHVEVTLDATVHQIPVVGTASTELTIVYGLSDVSSGGVDLQQGEALVSGELFGTPFSNKVSWDVPAPEPAPNAWSEVVDGQWLVTYQLSPPLQTDAATPIDATYGIRFFIFEGFRWQDQALPGYTDDVWDGTVGPPASMEPVLRFGANAYEVWAQF